MAYEYEIPAVNGKPLVEIPKELKDKVIDYTVLRDKIIIKASDLVDQLLYDTRVKVRDELGRLVKSITEYSYPPTASAIVCKDEDYVYAWKPANNFKGYILIDKGEAGVEDVEVIQSAIDNTLQGTIIIAKGEYNIKGVAVRIEGNCKNLRLVGYGAILKVNDKGHNLITIRKGDFATKPENIVVEGFYLDGTPDMCAIAIQGGKNVTVRDCFITNAYIAGIEITHYLGEYSEDIKIIGNKIFNCGGMGIYVGTGAKNYTRKVIIENNIIDTTGVSDYVDKDGIFVDGGYDVSIKGNKIYNAKGHGIGIYSYADVLNIEDNTVVNASGVGVRCGGVEFTSCKIVHNKIFSCLRGIALVRTVANVVVEDNRIKDSTEHGIFVSMYSSDETLHDIKLLHNIISGCGKQGIRVSGYYPDVPAVDIDVIGNTVKNCSLSSAGDYDGIQFNYVQHGKIERNRVSGANHRYNIRTENASDYIDIVLNVLRDYHTGQLSVVGTNNVIKQNRGYITENSGTAKVTGNGTDTTYTVDIDHGLVKDKAIARITLDREGSVDKVYLVDKDGDGFKETLRVVVTYDTAPADGEEVPIYWEAEVI